MIELRNLTKYYPVNKGLHYILRDVSLTIPSRTNLAILGPNGAGKSTFLRLIGGSEPADSGSIITDDEISWPLGLSTGFQQSLTARQNVLFVCRINGLNHDESRHVVEQVKDFSGLGEYFDMPMSTYSSGMGGRVKFGLSLAFDFDVYLIDELTATGDTIFKEKAAAAFERICKNASLIYVSHSEKTLKEFCQSALFLRDGLADFYPNIDDGIEAYKEYIESHRDNKQPKQEYESKVVSKFWKNPTILSTASGDSGSGVSSKNPILNTGGLVAVAAKKTVRVAAKKAARVAAKKAARVAARKAARLTEGGNSPASVKLDKNTNFIKDAQSKVPENDIQGGPKTKNNTDGNPTSNS